MKKITKDNLYCLDHNHDHSELIIREWVGDGWDCGNRYKEKEFTDKYGEWSEKKIRSLCDHNTAKVKGSVVLDCTTKCRPVDDDDISGLTEEDVWIRY